MERRTADAPACPRGHDRARPVHDSRSEFTNDSNRQACLGASSAGAPVRDRGHRHPSSANGGLTLAVRIGRRRHPRGRPGRDVSRRPGRRACAHGPPRPRPSGRETCSIPHTARSPVRRARTRSENSMSAMVRPRPTGRGGAASAPTEPDRGRPVRGSSAGRRRRLRPARRQRRRLPRQLRRRREGDDTAAATATRCPRSWEARPMPRRTETSGTGARVENADVQRHPAVQCAASVCRQRPPPTSSAAHRPSLKHAGQAVQRIRTGGQSRR